jgi:Rrf2 family protein
MLRIKASSYGLLAVYEIAKEHKGTANPLGVRASDISKKYRLPKAYTAKVLSQLANCGVLSSDRGPRGGFRLNRSADRITLYDILEGVGGLNAERTNKPGVPALPPALDEAFNEASTRASACVKDLFEKTTLADVLSKN